MSGFCSKHQHHEPGCPVCDMLGRPVQVQNCSTCLHWDLWETGGNPARPSSCERLDGWGWCNRVHDADAPMRSASDSEDTDLGYFETASTFYCSEWRAP